MMQVLKGPLSVHQPTVMCDGFVCEEGEDLDWEELEANAASDENVTCCVSSDNIEFMMQVLKGRLNVH